MRLAQAGPPQNAHFVGGNGPLLKSESVFFAGSELLSCKKEAIAFGKSILSKKIFQDGEDVDIGCPLQRLPPVPSL